MVGINDFFAKSNDGVFGQTVYEHCVCVGELAICVAEFFGYKTVFSQT